MKIHRILFIAGLVMAMSACDVVRQVGGAYNMVQCKYEYNSISKLSLSGMDLSNGISLGNIAQITSLFTGKSSSVPLNFTLNLDVTNPNQSAALLNGLQYILNIDDVEFTTGSVSKSLDIPAGGKQVLPLAIGFDLAQMLKGETKDAVTNIAKNFIGIGDKTSKVTLQIKPTFTVAGYAVTSPVYIPVNFSFGGGK